MRVFQFPLAVYRQRPRRPWLGIQMLPAPGDKLPWLRRRVWDELAQVDDWAPRRLPWLGIQMLPAPGDKLPWLRRRVWDDLLAADDAPSKRWFPGLTTVAAPAIDNLPWLRRRVWDELAQVDDPTPRRLPWLGIQMLPAPLDQLTWLRRRIWDEAAVDDQPARRAWFPGLTAIAVDQLPWRRRPIVFDPEPDVDLPRRGLPWLGIQMLPAPGDMLAWLVRPRAPFAEPLESFDPRPPSAALFSPQQSIVIAPPSCQKSITWSSSAAIAVTWSSSAAIAVTWSSSAAIAIKWVPCGTATMAVQIDISVPRGEDATITASPATQPPTNISGFTLVFTVKKNFGDATALLTKSTTLGGISITNGPGGVFTVSLLSGDLLSASLPAGDYWYDVRRTDNGANDLLAWGMFSITNAVGVN